jgi:nickel-dependent lactate racemase
MEPYFLWDKGQKIFFQLPKTWQVLNNAVLESTRREKTVYQMVSESIANPIGTLPLREMIRSKDKIVIIVDDFARPTPKMEILKSLIGDLKKFGINYSQIDILFGVGTHRPLSGTEVEEALGRDFFHEIRYTIHDSWSETLVPVGSLKTGTEIKINPLLLKADFRIGIGSIIPHPMGGFGGGGKIIMPGVANYEAIREHHMRYMIAEGVSIGHTKDNPFYDEICEAARLARLDFIINCVYNSKKEVMEIVSGHFEKAHQFGMDLSLQEYGVDIEQAGDVSIVSAFPLDEGPQILKALVPAVTTTKRGGTVILVASIRDGRLPDALLKAFDVAFGLAKDGPKRLVMDYLGDGKLILEDAPMDFNCALNTTLLNLSYVNVILVSREIAESQAKRLGFGYAESTDGAVEKVYKNIPTAKVNILPAGGLVVPQVKEESTVQ